MSSYVGVYSEIGKLKRVMLHRPGMELEHFTLGGLRKAVFDGDVKTGSVMAGQVAGMLHEIKPLRQIFEEMTAQCGQTLKNLEGMGL